MSETTSQDAVRAAVAGDTDAATLTDGELLALIDTFESAYRRGAPLISNERFDDEFLAELERRSPEHPRLHQVAAEDAETFGADLVEHRQPMLSTDKAYDDKKVGSWIARVSKVAKGVGLAPADVRVNITPKLDGLAGNDDPVTGVLATRNNGLQGFDITYVFERGVVPVGGRGQGLGELVLEQDYFERHLSDVFDFPRNAMVGICKAHEVSAVARQTLAAGAARFVPFATLPAWEGSLEQLAGMGHEAAFGLLERWDVPYLTDGLVITVQNDEIQEAMGATSHHYRWQLALKRRGERVETTVREITYQTGRTGVVTPVTWVEPVRVSGATVSKASGHNVGLLASKGLGVGARVVLVRSGEVIPWIEKVLEPATLELPTECPSCAADLVREGDFLHCPNATGCPAQVERTLNHFFATMGNVDQFGPKTLERLVEQGVRTLGAIYDCSASDFERLGFGTGQSANLEQELRRSRTQQVEDWRFLAAFGLPHLGRGMSRRLLSHHRLEDLADIAPGQLIEIDGFGQTTAPAIAEALRDNWGTIEGMIRRGFALKRTPFASEAPAVDSPIAGKGIVFTGTMEQGSRKDMEQQAEALGATVQKSVTKGTDYLVCGAKVGASKTGKAEKLGTMVLTEAQYRAMLEGE